MGAVGTRHFFIIVFMAATCRVIGRTFIRDVRLDISGRHTTERRQGFGLIIQGGILHKALRRSMQGVNGGRNCKQGRLRCHYGVRIKRNDRSIPSHMPIIMFAKQIQASGG